MEWIEVCTSSDTMLYFSRKKKSVLQNYYIGLSFKKDNMDLKKHYDDLYRNSIKKIAANEYNIDERIDSPYDRRFGITLLIRPSSEIKKRISIFLKKMKQIDPYQYFYKELDMHITVLSIISCYDGFSLSGIKVSEYIKIINEVLSEFNAFTIHFKGITASPSCILIQGFPQNAILNNLRNAIRSQFKKSQLENSIDTRYEIKTAHSTVLRFRKELSAKKEYLENLELFREYDFGSFQVNSLEFVYNDWYQRAESTIQLACFDLKSQGIDF